MTLVKQPWLEPSECTGCGACECICPKDVLKVELDESGHLYPHGVDGCIDCGACEKTCARRLELVPQGLEKPDIFAAWSCDDELRYVSTSGGAFTELARVVLARDGVVYGAAYAPDMSIVCSRATDEASLSGLRQSKYTQSLVGRAFRQVKDDLKAGRYVLFCGAPCQLAGLRAFLAHDYDNLYLIDFVCRGVNSPKAYKAWLFELEVRQGSSANRVWFKYKDGGWKSSPKRTRIDFSDGSSVVQEGDANTFMCGYLDFNLYLRPSCANCEFKGFPRQGDVTVADFWGLDDAIDDDKGASLIMVNTMKGKKLFETARTEMVVYGRSFDKVFAGNPCIDESAPLSPKSSEFLTAIDELGFEFALRKYGRKSFSKKVVAKLKSAAKKVVRYGK